MNNMKIQELMIGDWVVSNEHPEEYLKIYDIELYQNSVSCERINGLSRFPSPVDLNGILITEKFLIDNGFKKVVSTYDITNVNYLLTWCENYYVQMQQVREDNWLINIHGDYANINGGVGYVHELQHMLAVAGIKQEIIMQ